MNDLPNESSKSCNVPLNDTLQIFAYHYNSHTIMLLLSWTPIFVTLGETKPKSTFSTSKAHFF